MAPEGFITPEFWEEGCERLMRNARALLKRANYQVSAQALMALIRSMPATPQTVLNEEWRKSSFCWQWLQEAKERNADEQWMDLNEYFTLRVPKLLMPCRHFLEEMALGFLRGMDS